MSQMFVDATVLDAAIQQYDADFFLFSGPVTLESADQFIDCLRAIQTRRDTGVLFLTTWGGDPDSAYRIGRVLRGKYAKVRVVVCGACKSAGTLIALAADEIVMSDFGELGPLDTQLLREDDLIFNDSGLVVMKSLDAITAQAYAAFEIFLNDTIMNSGYRITTKTALEIAKSAAVGLFGPLVAQIDPLRLGTHARAMKITQDYGRRLLKGKNKDSALDRLLIGYPSHTFVIDREETQELLGNVRELEPIEEALAQVVMGLVRRPSQQSVVCILAAKSTGQTHTQHRGDSNAKAIQPPNGASPEGHSGGNGAKAEDEPDSIGSSTRQKTGRKKGSAEIGIRN